MREFSKNHPLRRIREAFKNTSGASELREFHSSDAFALLIGRAPSSVRNVESGHTKKWDRLAKHIERKIGVSAQWMLGNPEPSDPILDVNGEPWDPEHHLDYLGGGEGGVNWRLLMMTSPRGAVRLATKLVEIKLLADLVNEGGEGGEGSKSRPISKAFLTDLAQLLARHHCLDGVDFNQLAFKAIVGEEETLMTDLVMAISGGGKSISGKSSGRPLGFSPRVG